MKTVFLSHNSDDKPQVVAGLKNGPQFDEQLFILIAQQRVGNRPGRKEPRATKRRPKPFPRLDKPRETARNEVIKHGHGPKN